jgi:hypothetical protein
MARRPDASLSVRDQIYILYKLYQLQQPLGIEQPDSPARLRRRSQQLHSESCVVLESTIQPYLNSCFRHV